MYYDEHRLSQISNEIYSIYDRYREDYELLKENADLQKSDNIIWCDGWIDPYNADYISDIADGTIPERKILKRPPSKMEYKAKHMFNDKSPVFSLFFGEAGELTCEKYFISNSEKTVGAMFEVKTKMLFELTVEYRDDDGNVTEYNSLRIDNKYNNDILIKGRKYYYEDRHIIKAASIDKFKYGEKIIQYNDPIYRNVGLLLDSNCPRMNPMLTDEYEFTYGFDGLPESWIRTSYSCGKKFIHTWKMKKSLIKKYVEYGINCFLKNE